MGSTERRDFSATVAAAGGTYDFIDEIVPPNCTIVIKEIGLDLDNVAGWTFCHWQILKNGVTIYPLGDTYDQIGYAANRQTVQNVKFHGGSRWVVRGINDHAVLAIGMLLNIEYEIVDND